MKKTDVILLFDNELHATAKGVVELKASLGTEEIISSVGTGHRTNIKPKGGVAPLLDGLLVEKTAIPIIMLPKGLTAHLATFRIFGPTVSCLAKDFNGIVIG